MNGLCGILGLDPLYMANEGKLVAFIPKKGSDKILAEIKKTKYGKNAAIIGEVTKGNGVFLNTIIGGTRKLKPQTGESLPRIC